MKDLVTRNSLAESLRSLTDDTRKKLEKDLSDNRVFRLTYRDNFIAFVHDCIRWKGNEKPSDYQDEILSEFPVRNRVAVRGPHGLGKTALAAWIVIAFALTRDTEDWKIPTTASAWRQLTKYLWPEIHKWSKRIIWYKTGREAWKIDKELLVLSIKEKTGEAFAVTSNDSDLIEGAHADNLCYIFDEAKSIPNKTWDATEGAFASGDCYSLAISTPGDKSGRFYDIHRRAVGTEQWWIRHVKLEEAIKAGRISKEWAENAKKLWGEESPIYQARVLGEFAEQSSDDLISLSWIEKARENELEETGEKLSSMDVARFGSDDSVYMSQKGNIINNVEILHGHDTMRIAGLIKNKGIKCNIDEIGVGAGVVDRLKEQNFDCTGINVANKANDPENFANLRAELYWAVALSLKNGEYDFTKLSKAQYDRLCGELTNIKYKYNSKGQIQIEPKEDMKRRRGESPDMADALMLLQARPTSIVTAGYDPKPMRRKIW